MTADASYGQQLEIQPRFNEATSDPMLTLAECRRESEFPDASSSRMAGPAEGVLLAAAAGAALWVGIFGLVRWLIA